MSFAFYYGCKKTDDGSYVAPITISEKIVGTWALVSVMQVDEIAKANNETTTKMELSSQFTFSSLNITFLVDANNKPSSYSIAGTAPALLAPAGFWDLDLDYPHADGGTPSKINLYSDAAKTTKTATLDILALPGSLPNLQFTFTRKVNGVPFVSYNYKFSILNQAK